MKLGIVGLPNVGKSTLFNAITKAGAQCANYPFCTIEPNVGVVAVPDERLNVLAQMHSSEKITPATIEFVDIAGLVQGASRGEGLGNKFLSHIREVDAIIHVVRCFGDENVTHVSGSVDPARDIEIINLELIMADLESVERGLARAEKQAKQGIREAADEASALKKAESCLKSGQPARFAELTGDEEKAIRGFSLLTGKPVIYAANLDEGDFSSEGITNPYYEKLLEIAKNEGAEVLPISAKIEEELSTLPDEEKEAFLTELGLNESGLMRLVRKSYGLLGLISFLTTGPKETRAWPIKRGTKAPQAAGKIHGDFERGFIRAEVIAYEDLIEVGSMAVAREKGLLRSEGKEYVIEDGDVVIFRFNV